MRSGSGQSFLFPYLRCITSAMDLKSSACPCVVTSLNLRYSLFAGRPCSKTAIEPVVLAPWLWDISKHSIRSGRRGRFSSSFSFLTAPCSLASWYSHCSFLSERYFLAFAIAMSFSFLLKPLSGTIIFTSVPLICFSHSSRSSESLGSMGRMISFGTDIGFPA